MSVPRKDKPLLTPTEKERLSNPQTDPNIRKRNNLIVKEKIKLWLNDAKDVYFALNYLKDTKIEGIFPDENIFTLFKTIEKLLERLHFGPVFGKPQHPAFYFTDALMTKRDARKYKDSAPGMVMDVWQRATPHDLERNYQVQEFVENLKLYYPDDLNESPAYRLYREKKNKRLSSKEVKDRVIQILGKDPWKQPEAECNEQPPK